MKRRLLIGFLLFLVLPGCGMLGPLEGTQTPVTESSGVISAPPAASPDVGEEEPSIPASEAPDTSLPMPDYDTPWDSYSVQISTYGYSGMEDLYPEDLYPEFLKRFLSIIIYSDNMDWDTKINDALHTALGGWIDEKIASECWPEPVNLDYSSGRYLSVHGELGFIPRENFCNEIREGCTIDLVAGKQVMLDDLLGVNEEFMKALKSCEILIFRYPEDFYGGAAGARDWFSGISDQRLMEMLQDCSKTPYDHPYADNYYELFEKSTFYLQRGRICLVLVEHERKFREYVVDIDRIEGFLKVSKW